MSQERMEYTSSRVAPVGSLPQTPNIHDVLSNTNRALDKVRVIYGANERYFDHMSGKSVGSVRKSLKDSFNIPEDSTSIIDGKQVNDDFILQSGHNLEFKKQAGVKGKQY